MIRLSRWAPAAVAVLAVCAAGWLLLRDRRAGAQQAERLSKLESENRDLRVRAEALAREMEASRPGVPAPPQPEPGRPAGAEPSRRGEPGVSLEQAKLLIQFREKLAAANRAIEQMQSRIDELQAAADKTAEENRRVAAAEADLKQRLAGTSGVLEAVQAELKAKENRLAQLETLNAGLREENRASAARLAQFTPALRDLEELDRRREAYLAAILRRYKDVTEQYRALSGRLEKPEEGVPAELSRIRESIALAEEDLRQLSGLNAQANRVQRRLAAR